MKKIGLLFVLLYSNFVFADAGSVIEAKIALLQAQMAQPFVCSCSAQQSSLASMQTRQLAALQAALIKAQASPSPSPSSTQ